MDAGSSGSAGHAGTARGEIRLSRRLGLLAFTLYGLGNILGAGIYVLVGKVAAEAGQTAPLAFIVAAIVAALAAATYAELATRFPVSAGEAVYVQQGFGLRSLTVVVGLMVAAAGLLSSATLTLGFVGYLHLFVAVPESVAVIAVVVVLCALACWGIAESVRVAAALTVLEAGGLLAVVLTAGIGTETLLERAPTMLLPADGGAVYGLLGGAFLAFFAYIGFEDMVNVAEEVKRPLVTIPRGIALALGISSLVYLLVVLACLNVLSPEELAATDAPLAHAYARASGGPATAIGVIGLVAVINGVLVQMIMAARVLYGMAANGWLPAALSVVSERTHTPVTATVLVSAIILLLALGLPILELAAGTSTLVLLVFIVCCGALLRIRARTRTSTEAGWRAPGWVPWLGMVLGVALLVSELTQRVLSP